MNTNIMDKHMNKIDTPQFSTFREYYEYILFWFLTQPDRELYFSTTNKDINKRDQILLRNFQPDYLKIYKHKIFLDTIILNIDHYTGINSKALVKLFSNITKYIKPTRTYRGFEYILTITYQNTDYKIEFWDYCKYVRGTTLKLHQADKKLLDYLDNCLNGLYTIKQADFTVDLYSEDNLMLYTILSHTLYQKFSQKSVNVKYSTTRYTGNTWKTQSRACKVYHKNKPDDPDYETRVRLENTYKKQGLKKLKIYTLKDLYNAEAEKIFANIYFKVFNVVMHNLFKKKKNSTNYRTSKKNYQLKHATITESIFFDSMNNKHYCGGLLAVKNRTYFIVYPIHNALDKYPFQDYFFGLLKNKNFEG
jgi:hypothetical protein